MPLYAINTPAESLSAGTPKTVLAWVGGATRRHKIRRLNVGGSSVVATDAPMLIECGTSTQAGAGTSTAITPVPIDQGETASLGAAARTYTVEPTVITVLDTFRVSPIGNTFLWEIPPGREYFMPVSKTFALRVTSPAAQTNATFSALVEE